MIAYISEYVAVNNSVFLIYRDCLLANHHIMRYILLPGSPNAITCLWTDLQWRYLASQIAPIASTCISYRGLPSSIFERLSYGLSTVFFLPTSKLKDNIQYIIQTFSVTIKKLWNFHNFFIFIFFNVKWNWEYSTIVMTSGAN